MTVMRRVGDNARSFGDPRVISKGPGSLGTADQLAKGLGWFSIGLGLVELLAAPRLARALGMEGSETLLRAYGARELAAGLLTLSVDRRLGIGSRVAGDALDLATLMTARRSDNPQRANVDLALAAVAGVTALDIICSKAQQTRHSRPGGPWRDYGDRTGLPRGVQASRGLAASSGSRASEPSGPSSRAGADQPGL